LTTWTATKTRRIPVVLPRTRVISFLVLDCTRRIQRQEWLVEDQRVAKRRRTNGDISTRLLLERDTGKLDYGLLSVSIPSGPHLRSFSLVRSSTSTVKLISEDERSGAVDLVSAALAPVHPSLFFPLRFLHLSYSFSYFSLLSLDIVWNNPPNLTV